MSNARPRRDVLKRKTTVAAPTKIRDIRRAAPDAPYEFLVDGKWIARKFLGSDPAASVANYKAANPGWKKKCAGWENPPAEAATAPASAAAPAPAVSPAPASQPKKAAPPRKRQKPPASAAGAGRNSGGGKKQKGAKKGDESFNIVEINTAAASLAYMTEVYMTEKMSKPTFNQVTEQVKTLASGMSAAEKVEFMTSITSALFG